MYKQPLQLSRADMVSLAAPQVDEDDAVTRIKRLTNEHTIVNDALAQTGLRFSLVKYEKPMLRVA